MPRNHLQLIKACSIFFSRVILNKLSPESKSFFRKLEVLARKYEKLNADLQFLKFCSNNQILPKFANFNLYDMSKETEPSRVEYKNKLIKQNIIKKEEDSTSLRIECLKSVINFKKVTSTFYFYSSIYLLQRNLS